MSPVEILGVVALILIFARICMIVIQRRKQSGNQRRQENKAYIPEIRIGTVGPHLLTVEQLTADTSKVVCRFRITSIPGSGIRITRHNGDPWSINLRVGMACTATVRMPHAALAEDGNGFFLQALDGSPMACGGSVTDEITITSGMIVYLDQQPLRFYIHHKAHNKSRAKLWTEEKR